MNGLAGGDVTTPKAFDYEYVEVRASKPKPARPPAVITEALESPAEIGPFPDAGLFRDAKSAIRFAVTCDGSPARPASSRMLDTTTGARDFAALDRAAQAGMIMNILEGQGRVQVATLIASAAPRFIQCACRRPCCSGKRLNSFWRSALDTLAQDSVYALTEGSKLNYALRAAIIVKIYGGGQTYKDIADELILNQETVSRQHRSIYSWLKGAKAGRTSDAIEGVESIAWREAETALRRHGIVG